MFIYNKDLNLLKIQHTFNYKYLDSVCNKKKIKKFNTRISNVFCHDGKDFLFGRQRSFLITRRTKEPFVSLFARELNNGPFMNVVRMLHVYIRTIYSTCIYRVIFVITSSYNVKTSY